MFRTLRAFAWMRWRVLMNSLERTGARDVVERFSLAVEQIGVLITLGLLVPSAAALAALGAYAGYGLATGATVMMFEALCLLLLAACTFSAVGPLLMPSIERPNAVQLLLLPIPRRLLYVAQAVSAVSEPWTLLAIPLLLSISAGLAAAGALVAAATALVAAVLLIIILIGLSTLSTLVLHLIVRDRRRGELAALILIFVPMLAMMAGLLGGQRTHEDRLAERTTRAERRDGDALPEWVLRTARYAYALAPSELYARVGRSSTRGEPGGAMIPLLALAACGTILHGLGMLTFGRLLDSPASGERRQAGAETGSWRVRLPGLSRGSAAVAQAQVRLAMRTPRGRSILLSPLVVFVMFAIIMRRGGGDMDIGLVSLGSGLALATFGSAVCLLSILPFAMNQFAIDRAGLTLALLSPLDDRELLTGKAVGNAIIAGGPALLCLILASVLFPGGAPALWLSLPLALLATYALAAPGAAALSAVFPRPVNLNSIGRGSNAHGAAGMLGLLVFVAAGLPCVLLVLVATGLLGRPALAPLLMIVWCGVALAISRALFKAVTVLFEKRRENLGMVVN